MTKEKIIKCFQREHRYLYDPQEKTIYSALHSDYGTIQCIMRNSLMLDKESLLNQIEFYEEQGSVDKEKTLKLCFHHKRRDFPQEEEDRLEKENNKWFFLLQGECDGRPYTESTINKLAEYVDLLIEAGIAERLVDEAGALKSLGLEEEIQGTVVAGNSYKIHPAHYGSWCKNLSETEQMISIWFDRRQLWNICFVNIYEGSVWCASRNGIRLKLNDRDFTKLFGRWKITDKEGEKIYFRWRKKE